MNDQAHYEAMLVRDKRDELLQSMTLAERVEYEQARARQQPVRSALDAFADLPLPPRRHAGKVAPAVPAVQIEAPLPPDNAALARQIEELQQKVAALEEAEEHRRQQGTHALYKMRR